MRVEENVKLIVGSRARIKAEMAKLEKKRQQLLKGDRPAPKS